MKFEATTPGPLRTILQAAFNERGLLVTDYGALGNGAADDTAAIQAAINAANGRVPVLFPPGTYMVSAATGILLNVAGTHLVLSAGATLKAITNSLTNYSVVTISAADCAITGGGTVQGDVQTHTGSTGEWGHCITVGAAAHRTRLQGITVKHGWGDGVYVGGGAVQDVALVDVIADSNRRNGLSIVGALRCRVIGGSYIGTGSVASTAPAAGIDVEPNPSSGINVLDVVIDSVVASSNTGAGIQITRQTAQTTTVHVTSCVCRTNGTDGILVAGAAGSIAAEITANRCSNNSRHGINITAPGAVMSNNHCYSNSQCGVNASAKVKITSGVVDFNSQTGLNMGSGSDNSTVAGMAIGENCAGAATTYHEVDVTSTGFRMSGSTVRPSTSGNRALYAIMVRSGATTAVFNGVGATPGTSGIISPQGDTVQAPAVA